MPSTNRNGPEPTTGSPSFGSLPKLLTSFSDTSFQMCSGTIGIGSSGSTALGFFDVSTTVVSSGASTDSTPTRYDDQVAASGPPSSTRLKV